MSRGRWGRALLAMVALTGLVACLTMLFLVMRIVLEIGGSCGTGGFYRIAVPCPDQVVVLIPVIIIWGTASAFTYAMAMTRLPGPRLWPLLWSALFLLLGGNFLQFGLNPPTGNGVAVGWLVCAALFLVLGVVPLLILIASRSMGSVLMSDGPQDVPVDPRRPSTDQGPTDQGPAMSLSSVKWIMSGATVIAVIGGVWLGSWAVAATAG